MFGNNPGDAVQATVNVYLDRMRAMLDSELGPQPRGPVTSEGELHSDSFSSRVGGVGEVGIGGAPAAVLWPGRLENARRRPSPIDLALLTAGGCKPCEVEGRLIMGFLVGTSTAENEPGMGGSTNSVSNLNEARAGVPVDGRRGISASKRDNAATRSFWARVERMLECDFAWRRD